MQLGIGHNGSQENTKYLNGDTTKDYYEKALSLNEHQSLGKNEIVDTHWDRAAAVCVTFKYY